MQEVTQERTGLSWFRPRGSTSSKGCASALYYLAPGVPVVGDTSEAREEGSSQVSARGGDCGKCQYRGSRERVCVCSASYVCANDEIIL